MESKQNKNTFQVNHFLMIPFEASDFVTEYTKFCDELIAKDPDGFDKELLQKPGKLHMTITILSLNMDEIKVKQVALLLESIQEEIKQLSESSINFSFEKFETMEPKNQARVVYGKMKEDESYYKLTKVIHLIIKTLVDAGFIDKDKLADNHIEFINGQYSITLHLTLLNVTFWNKILKKQKKKPKKNFDATEIMSTISGFQLPPCKLDKFNFCVMREDKKTEKYELVQSFEL